MDMGEGDTANRSTANTLSKIAIQDVEALQKAVKTFIETYVINELLLEGGFEEALYEESKKVYMKFGSVDKEIKSKEENQTIQLWLNKLISQSEARKRLGERPVDESFSEDTYYKIYEEKLALLKLGVMQDKKDSAKNISENKARPENQHGVREAPKFNKDVDLVFNEVKNAKNEEDILKVLEKLK